MSIPRVIHQIWIGPKVPPVKWMETWAEKNPKMGHRIWRESDIDAFKLKNRDKYDYYMKRGIYDGAADVARVEILEKFGGVYIDADAVCLAPIDGAFFMNSDFFAGIEYDNRIANAIIGCTPNHPIITIYRDMIQKATVLEPACYTIGGTMLTLAVGGYLPDLDEKVTILHQNTFYPKWKHRGTIQEKMFSRHMWGSTKGLYE